MNKTVQEAKNMQEGEYKGYIPEVEIGEICEINDIWDGKEDCPEESYSYQIGEQNWINYKFEVVEEKENKLDTLVKITKIELL